MAELLEFFVTCTVDELEVYDVVAKVLRDHGIKSLDIYEELTSEIVSVLRQQMSITFQAAEEA